MPGTVKTVEAPAKNWRVFIESLSEGDNLGIALLDAGMSRAQLEKSLRTNPERQFEYEEAKILASRSRWTTAELEDVMDAIVLGDGDGDLSDILAGKGKDHVDFLRLIERDPHVGAMYAEARLLWAERKVDDLVKLVESEEKLDKARFDMAKWLMGVMNDKFKSAQRSSKDMGGAKELEAKLEAGRKRVEELWAEREAAGEDMGVFG